MQKKLIAAAVAALVSTGAMAEVTIYGRVDLGYNTTDVDVNVGGTVTTLKRTNMGFGSSKTSSRLGFNVNEDLGGGLKAFGQAELGIANAGALQGADNGGDGAAPFSLRTLYVGLASDAAGSLTIGRVTTLVDAVLQAGDVCGVCNVAGSIYAAGFYNSSTDVANAPMKFNNSRSSQTVTYASPNFNGFSFAAQYATGETDVSATVTGDLEHTETGLSVSYKAGPLMVTAGMSDEELKEDGVAVSEPSQMAIAGSYDFGVAKLHLTYMDGDNKTAGQDISGRDGIQVGATFPLGAATLWASFYTGEATYVGEVYGDDYTGMQLGVNYALSKRTSAYAIYGANEVEYNEPGVIESLEHNTIAVGIRHDF